MKGYMEDGAFSRGRDIITAEGSIVFVGNLDGDIETIVRTSNLFYPMPKEMDTAFYDRIHAYIPGWEFQKTRDDAYTNHFGLVTDYLAEVFRELRKRATWITPSATSGSAPISAAATRRPSARSSPALSNCSIRTARSPRKRSQEYLAYAMEMRRRVKEQLKKMGGLEYWDTSFSYHRPRVRPGDIRPRSRDGRRQPDCRGSLPPGSIYTIGTDAIDNRLALFLLQAQMNPGSGRIIPLGNLSSTMKEAIKTADAYLKREPEKPRHRPRTSTATTSTSRPST